MIMKNLLIPLTCRHLNKTTHYFPDSMKYICLFPGASSFIKMWPKENFRDLISALKEDLNYILLFAGLKMKFS